MVSDLVERIRTEEPDAGVPHVRICGEGAGQPVPLPGGFDKSDFRDLSQCIAEIVKSKITNEYLSYLQTI
jgi:hypothetical protein